MYRYWLVFDVNSGTDEGRGMLRILDCEIEKHHIKGFDTKSEMKRWIEQNNEALDCYQMLKPIT